MAGKFGPRKIFSIREQLARMRGLYPHFRSRIQGSALVVEGDLRPTARSVSYQFRIEYEADRVPRVHILSPELRIWEGAGGLPHVYPEDRLCLYLPDSDDWKPDKSLAHTVVPWISEWLFFYEVWFATGEWLGGGVEPAKKKPFRKEPREKHERK